jgi:hypothetical protein
MINVLLYTSISVYKSDASGMDMIIFDHDKFRVILGSSYNDYCMVNVLFYAGKGKFVEYAWLFSASYDKNTMDTEQFFVKNY